MSVYFALVPSNVLCNKKISDSSKILYGVILGLSNKYGYCYASNDYLAVDRDVSLATLKRYLKELRDNKLIIVEISSKNVRRITPIIEPTPYEKHLRNEKTVLYSHIDDDVANALDTVWRRIK